MACPPETVGDIFQKPYLLYHRLLLPNWLRNNADWSCDYEGDDLRLVIKEDSAPWECIFRVQLLPRCLLDDDPCADITVNMVIGVMDCANLPDSLSFMLSDGDFAMGFQLVDSADDPCVCGPIRAVEGEAGKTLRNPNVNVAITPCTPCKNNVGEINVSCKPRAAWGKASCAVADGIKVVAQYSDCLDLTKGLKLELYRFNCTDRYTINYIEVTVYKDSPRIFQRYVPCPAPCPPEPCAADDRRVEYPSPHRPPLRPY